MDAAIAALNDDGYEIVGVTPITRGVSKTDYHWDDESGYGWGYGFSIPAALMIFARLIEQPNGRPLTPE